MVRTLRRLLPILLVVTGATTVLTGTAAYAVDCTANSYKVCVQNNSALPVTYVDDWCWGDHGNPYEWDIDTESWVGQGCGSFYTAYVGGVSNPATDVDSVRADANCMTTINGVNYNRYGLGSHWHRYSYEAGVRKINVSAKYCYGPTGLYVSNSSFSSIRLSWTPIVSDSSNDGIGYGIYMNGTIIATRPRATTYIDINNLSPNTTYQFGVTMRRPYLESTPSIVYGTTGFPPPPLYPPETAPDTHPTVSYANLYYVNTFGEAPGKLGASVAGYVFPAYSNYVFCKKEWGVTTGPYGYNKWWLYTDLDTGGRAWISAYYLADYGNDEAYANGGGPIPLCG
ncbi:fibronectin type III domain-containing protein [Catellatospora methionotrophica]|uniref:fibronectin type III domain-containing protein n=1 Tax=Catellatospora methionotrophica TaxID=121620 RepID=UPI0033DB7235